METAITNLPFAEAPKVKKHAGNPIFGTPALNLVPRRGLNSQLDNALFNDIDPFRIVKKEQPWHRKAQALHASGHTIREIAAYVERDPATVSNALRQPHARENMISEIKQSVQDEMKDFLEAEVLPTLEVVKQIRDDPQARHADRLSASEQLLSRFLGKPTQPITQESKDVTKLSAAELDTEVRRALSGIPTTTGN